MKECFVRFFILLFVLSIPLSAQNFLPSERVSANFNSAVGHRTYTNGNIIYVCWTDSGQIYLRRSIDAGYTWQPIQSIGTGRSASFAFAGSNVYVVFEEQIQATGNNRIKFRRSNDGGISFATEQVIDEPASVQNCISDVQAGGNTVFVSWGDCRFSSTGPYYRVSTDFGVTFAATQMVAERGGPGKVAMSGNNVYFVYTDQLLSQVVVKRSANNGVTFGQPVFLFDGGMGSDSQIIAKDNNVYLVYPGAGNGGADVHLSRSNDFGQTFQSINVSNSISSNSNLVAMAVSGQNIVVAYNETFGGLDNIFVATSNDGGASFREPQNLSNTSTQALYAGVNIEGQLVYVAWQEKLGILSPFNFSTIYRASSDGGLNFNQRQVLFDAGITPSIRLINNMPVVTSNNVFSSSVHVRRSRPLPFNGFVNKKYLLGQVQP